MKREVNKEKETEKETEMDKEMDRVSSTVKFVVEWVVAYAILFFLAAATAGVGMLEMIEESNGGDMVQMMLGIGSMLFGFFSVAFLSASLFSRIRRGKWD